MWQSNMKKFISLLILNGLFSIISAQENPMNFQRWNIFDINKVRTEFNNTGLLCNGNQQSSALARQPSFEYPAGSGLSWGTGVGVAVGAPLAQDPGVVGGYPNPANDYYAFCDATLDEGPAAYWDEEHFFPYPQFVNGGKAAMSHQTETWPSVWPTNYPILNDEIKFDSTTGWPGFGKNGEQLADQESFSVVEAWGGTDQLTSTGPAYPNFLKTQMVIRGMAWEGTLYENFIVWVYILRNPTSKPITDLAMGIHADFSFLPSFYPGISSDDDRHYYDPKLQLAYGTDDNGYEENPNGGGSLTAENIAWAGVVSLKMPGKTGKVKSYDATHFWQGQTTASGSGGDPEMYYKWNLLNLNDPEDSDNDGIDDDFDHNGIADNIEGGQGYYLGLAADGLQVLGSENFTLNPGETDTLIFATVFGKSQDDIKTNASRAIALYNNDWKIVKAPPAPKVEAVATDQKVTIVWGTDSETDPEFEGYKVYRSQDNGQTWGSESFLDFDGGTHFIPLVQYDKIDGVKGYYQTLPEYAWFYLGEDSWVKLRGVVESDTIKGFNLGAKLKNFQEGDSVNIYVDRDVLNGIDYMYYVAAFDSGNTVVGPLENSAATNITEFNNTVSVKPALALESKTLNNIRVVPNPYKVSEIWETGFDEHKIQFTGLPESASIRIMNSAGELVKILEHNSNSSIAEWNLKNEYNQQIAPGVYFYFISSSIGQTTGKFFVIL